MQAIHRPKKRLFIALIAASLGLTALSAYGVWKVSFAGLQDISVYLPLVLGILLAGVLSVALIGLVGIVLAIAGLSSAALFQRQAWTAINLLFPIAVVLGKCFEIDKERIERSFIEVSNQIIRNRQIRVKPVELLLLAPHCLQEEKCPHKITRDPKNCKRCGRCPIGPLLELSDKYGIRLAVVTGGTLSRQIIKNTRPRAVLAIACERDLTSGIQDIYPLPVIGVLNERPCGPCNNTRVNVDRVEKAVCDFLGIESGN